MSSKLNEWRLKPSFSLIALTKNVKSFAALLNLNADYLVQIPYLVV